MGFLRYTKNVDYSTSEVSVGVGVFLLATTALAPAERVRGVASVGAVAIPAGSISVGTDDSVTTGNATATGSLLLSFFKA